MPATATTRENFPKATTALADVEAEQALRISAGAIRSTIDSTSEDFYVLITEWNIIGQND